MNPESSTGKAILESKVRLLRNTRWAQAADPDRKCPDSELLERFFLDPTLSPEERRQIVRQIGLRAPGVEVLSAMVWQNRVDGSIRDNEDERLLNEHVGIERKCRSLRNRFMTPYVPDADKLIRFRGIGPNDATTWPTLTDLKIATAMPEKEIRKIIASLQPSAAEIKRPLRRRKRGALPNRYHPRLVLGVLEQFVARLGSYSIDDTQRDCFRSIVMTVKRAVTSKFSRSCSMS